MTLFLKRNLPWIKGLFTWGIFSLILGTFVIACAPRGAVICTKGTPEERGGYQGLIFLGSHRHTNVLETLCQEDIDHILRLSDSLNPFQKQEMKALICGQKASIKGFSAFFRSLDDSEKANVIKAFAHYGYYIHGYG